MSRACHEGALLHVLFVCTGNICRSPTAERLAVLYARDRQFRNFTVTSAGTRAEFARPIHKNSAEVLKDLGADASGFGSRQLSARIAQDADLILTMTRAHRDAVLELAPRQLSKTFTLVEASKLTSEFEAQDISELAAMRPRLRGRTLADVPDPIGRSADYFREVGMVIYQLLPPILNLCQ